MLVLALRPLYQHRDEDERKALQMLRLRVKLKDARPEQVTDIGEGMTHRVGPEDDEPKGDEQPKVDEPIVTLDPEDDGGVVTIRRALPRTTQESSPQMSPQMSLEMSPQNISEGAVRVMRMIKEDDRIKVQTISDELNVSRRTVLRYVKELASVGLHFEGPTKKGRWVIDKCPVAKKKGGRK